MTGEAAAGDGHLDQPDGPRWSHKSLDLGHLCFRLVGRGPEKSSEYLPDV